MPSIENSHQATQALHADDRLNLVTDVAPPLHLSTIFRYPSDPNKFTVSEDPVAEFDGTNFVYSREFAPDQTRFEAILSSLLKGHAARAITVAHEVIAVVSRLSGLQKLSLDCSPEDLNEGDVILLETPINPLGTAFSIEEYAKKAHSRGAYLIVDSTFAPPSLQDPFLWSADIVMHSGSQYFGGHSDLLCDRLALGNVLGNMESWLGVRSLRTLEVRVQRASHNSAKLISWLHDALCAPSPAPGSEGAIVQAVLQKVYHASLQNEPWLKKQMPNGFGPVFSIVLHREDHAKHLPSKLHYFQHATSLGGVESLIEWRALSDPRVDRKLLRISVGLENWEDLKNDQLQAFQSLIQV
ncbi:Pyridoxal phosphate-dependent transferase major region subdomain 2 [Penicillium malachiteum]|uniref:Pyridoxal phosphate-dependent transferase major region subdomain 2 n=1 Tax=Penicillium malachiteum TaxID=1324776 RepID=A0AAD6HVT8_9EURO|nr:Pyridoxal phosphate-dependent transferase major region subdomain 2 [Penicillium malachiteum]